MKNNKLISIRKKRGLTQYEAAEILNVNQSAYAHWENGTRLPSFDNMKKICEKFQLEPNDFYECE